MKKIMMLLLVLALAPLARGFAEEIVPSDLVYQVNDKEASISVEINTLLKRQVFDDEVDRQAARKTESKHAKAFNKLGEKVDGNKEIILKNATADGDQAEQNTWVVVLFVVGGTLILLVTLVIFGQRILNANRGSHDAVVAVVRAEGSNTRQEVLQAVAQIPAETDRLVKTLPTVTRTIELSNGMVFEYTPPVVDREYQSLFVLPTTVMPPDPSKTRRYHFHGLSRVLNSTTTTLEDFYVGKKFDGADVQSRVQSECIRYAKATGELVQIK